MGSVNMVIVVGRLGADPELKTTPSGKAVCNFSVATDEYAGKGQEKRTEWHRITVWAEQAEACSKYLRKGSEVYVQGRLQTRSWEKDGQKRYATDIVAERVQFLGGKREGAPAESAPGGEEVPF